MRLLRLILVPRLRSMGSVVILVPMVPGATIPSPTVGNPRSPACGRGALTVLGIVVLPGAPASEVPASHELDIVYHPKGPEVILISYETLMQGQIGANSVLRVV